MNRSAPIIAGTFAAILLLFGAYMASYYGMMNKRRPDWLAATKGDYDRKLPAYRIRSWLVMNFLDPAHKLDRLIRPGYWGDN